MTSTHTHTASLSHVTKHLKRSHATTNVSLLCTQGNHFSLLFQGPLHQNPPAPLRVLCPVSVHLNASIPAGIHLLLRQATTEEFAAAVCALWAAQKSSGGDGAAAAAAAAAGVAGVAVPAAADTCSARPSSHAFPSQRKPLPMSGFANQPHPFCSHAQQLRPRVASSQ